MVTAELFQRYSLFTNLTPAQQVQMAGLAQSVQAQPGEALFREGNPADMLWLLLVGRVALYHNVRSEAVTSTRTLVAMNRLMEGGTPVPLLEGQSDIFKEYQVGEVAAPAVIGISVLVPPHRLTATARVIQPSHLLKLNGVAVREFCQADPRLGYGVMGAIAQTAMERLHFARQQLTEMSRSA